MRVHVIYKFIGSAGALSLALIIYFGAPVIAAYYEAENPPIRIPVQSGAEFNRVPIFLFHNLDGDGKYSISRHEFRRYLEIIKEENVDVISLRDLYEASRSNRRFSRPSCVITIDDNFKNIMRIAAPLLREFSYPASLFVYITNISNNPRSGTSWEDLDRLRKEGFEIQNHSYTHTAFHVRRSGESSEAYSKRVDREIISSREVLEENLPGLKIYVFAYPMGYYSPALRERLFRANYSLLLTTDASSVDLDKPFTGTFDRYTIQHLDKGDFKTKFRKILAKARTPAYRKITLTPEEMEEEEKKSDYNSGM